VSKGEEPKVVWIELRHRDRHAYRTVRLSPPQCFQPIDRAPSPQTRGSTCIPAKETWVSVPGAPTLRMGFPPRDSRLLRPSQALLLILNFFANLLFQNSVCLAWHMLRSFPKSTKREKLLKSLRVHRRKKIMGRFDLLYFWRYWLSDCDANPHNPVRFDDRPTVSPTCSRVSSKPTKPKRALFLPFLCIFTTMREEMVWLVLEMYRFVQICLDSSS
jgi:hypothetical protein